MNTSPANTPLPIPQVALAACAFVLSKTEDGAAWVQMLPAGFFKPSDGRTLEVDGWTLDEDGAAQLIARANERKTLAVVDYEHQTLKKDENGQIAPAAGWIIALEWRGGSGLWGKVRYTERAQQLIEAGEYRYFSPVFFYDPADGRVLQLIMGALTNDPAIDGMAPLAEWQALAAACFELSRLPLSPYPLSQTGDRPGGRAMQKDPSPSAALCQALGLEQGAGENAALAALSRQQEASAQQHKLLAAVKSALGLTPNASNEALLAAASAARSDAGKPDPAQYVPLAAVQELQGQFAALSAQVEGREVDALVSGALADGRLLPALEDWARDYGAKDRAGLKAFLQQSAPFAALTRLQGASAPSDGLSLSDDERRAARLLGISAQDFAQSKAAKATQNPGA